MRIKTKTILTIVLGLAVLMVGGVFVWRHFHTSKTQVSQSSQGTGKINDVNYGPPTDAQKKAGSQTKQQSIQDSLGTNPLTSPTVTLTIARLGQVSAGQNVNLRATLSNEVSGGQCTAIFTQTGKPTVTVTAGITSDPSYYSCEPIDISASQFGSGGSWLATIYVEQGGSIVSNKAARTVVVQP